MQLKVRVLTDDNYWIYGEYPYLNVDMSGTHLSMAQFWQSIENPHNRVRRETISWYTGIKDKHKDDVFEGDIIYNENCFGCVSSWGDTTDHYPTRRLVLWDAEDLRFNLFYIEEIIRSRGCSGYSFCTRNSDQFEIIGNIYQDSELVEQKND